MQIETRKLAHKYSSIQGDYHYALKDIDLKIAKDEEFIFILGHTGSGKSTLIQHLNMLLEPTEGTINILDINNRKNFKLKDIRQHVGLVFQFSDYQLFEETCIKDVEFGPKNFGFDNYHELALASLKEVGLEKEFYERSPFTLSGGQMRKVAIAGVLAYKPDVIILDEPTVGLDKQSEEQIMSVIDNLNRVQHKSIIIVSHDMDLACRFAKRILVLNSGKLVFDGKKEELFTDTDLIKKTSLDLPTSMKLAKKIKKELQIPMNTNCYSLDDIILSLEDYYG